VYRYATGDAMRVLMEDSGRGAEAGESPWAGAEAVPPPPPAQPDETNDDDANGIASNASDAVPPHKALDDLTNKGGAHTAAPGKTGKTTMTTTTTEAGAAEETGGDEGPGRCNPTAGFEFTCGVLSVDEKDGRVLAVAPGVGLREFAFDAVFADQADQGAVYEKSARPLIADFINGFNGTMLVYGQTGSGKTHTMFGPGPGGDAMSQWEERGVIPRACEEVLEAAAARTALGIVSTVSASYVVGAVTS
jgi:hypothetical protein